MHESENNRRPDTPSGTVETSMENLKEIAIRDPVIEIDDKKVEIQELATERPKSAHVHKRESIGRHQFAY